jgi:hypothetical protein
MEKHITTIADFLNQMAGSFTIKDVSTDEGVKHCLETSYRSHGQELKDILEVLNRMIDPYFILINQSQHIEDDDMEVWSYYFTVVDTDAIQLPLYLCSDLNRVNGLWAMKVNSKQGYEGIRISSVVNYGYEISDIHFDTVIRNIKEGHLMLCSEDYFRDKFAEVTEVLFKKANYR